MTGAVSDTRGSVGRRTSAWSWYAALFFCLGVAGAFAVANSAFFHWFLIPVLACGVLATHDAVEWMRGRVDLFDPVGIIGLIGVHFFFVAPLLHVQWDFWLWTGRWSAYLPEPSDWRVWVGWLEVVNLAGLAIYRLTWRRISAKKPSRRTLDRRRVIQNDRFLPLVFLSLGISGLAQVVVYLRFGGIGGYVEAFEHSTTETFRGLGPVFMISESFPIIAMLAYAQLVRGSRAARSWVAVIVALTVFFVLKLLFGGLRGSRSNTVWGLIWAVGIVHFWIRKIPRKVVAAGLVLLFAFLYIYGFYKSAGREAFDAIQSGVSRQELEAETGRSVGNVLLGDLGRTDVQAYMLYAAEHPYSDYEYAWGRTYLAAATLVIPRSIWPSRPAQRGKEGAEIFFGQGSWRPGRRYSSRVYGLVGESLLNFPAYFAPLAFAVLGLVVGWVRRLGLRLRARDARLLLVPFLANLCFLVLVSDASLIVFYVFKNGLLPILVIWLGSTTVVERRASPREAVPAAAGRPTA